MNPLKMKSWSPYVVGAAIGILSWFSFATVDQPIGITSAFEATAALGIRALLPASQTQDHAFYQQETPRIDWEWMLVLGVFIGAWLSSILSKDRPNKDEKTLPSLWRWRFGPSQAKRLLGAFGGGALMMFGARLADGCTSGHGISGSLQLAASSWLFVVVMFASATLSAFAIFGKEGRHHVR